MKTNKKKEMFLEGKFAPTTLAMGFIEASLETVGDSLLSWSRRAKSNCELIPLSLEIGEAVARLEPLTMPRRRELLIATDSVWTTFLDNTIDGSDPYGPVSYLAEELSCRSVLVRCVPHTLHTDLKGEYGMYGAFQFELFGPKRGKYLNTERAVSLVYESGKWDFYTIGTELPFENIQNYRARRRNERLTCEMLESYCSALKIRISDEHFYLTKALLLASNEPLPPSGREMSIEEARRQFGLND